MCVQLHVRSCGYPPSLIKRIANGPLSSRTKFQQNPSSRSRYMEKRCARAHVHLYPTCNFCKTPNRWVSSHTPNFSTIHPAVPEIRKKGTHVQLYPIIGFCKRLANGSLTTSKFQRNPSSRLRDTEKGHICTSARADVPHP